MSRRNCAKDCLFSSAAAVLLAVVLGSPSAAQEAKWIWSPDHERDAVPQSTCHFRKMIVVRSPQRAQVSIIADDEYELFINGRRAAGGTSSDELQEHDVSRYLSRGRNLIAIKATNTRGSTGAVAARVMIQTRDGNWRSYSTDGTWKTNLDPLPFWNTMLYNDNRWAAAQELGRLGEAAPWDLRETVAGNGGNLSTERFKLREEF